MFTCKLDSKSSADHCIELDSRRTSISPAATFNKLIQFSNHHHLNSGRLIRQRLMKAESKRELTPPAPPAMAGAIRTFAFLKTSTASAVHGMFEPAEKKNTSTLKK